MGDTVGDANRDEHLLDQESDVTVVWIVEAVDSVPEAPAGEVQSPASGPESLRLHEDVIDLLAEILATAASEVHDEVAA